MQQMRVKISNHDSIFDLPEVKFIFFFFSNGYSTSKVTESAEYLKSKMHVKPKIGIICGSGLGGIGEIVTNKKVILYKEIPSFVESTGVLHFVVYLNMQLLVFIV